MNGINATASVISKDYHAPMELVYAAWTQQEHLCKWQVPNADIKCEYQFANIETGGSALHKMIMPSGGVMWLLTEYHELSPHHTIVFSQYPSNEEGEILPPNMPNWPKELRATIKLTESDGITHMNFSWQPVNPSQAEAEAWEASKSEHGKGWGGGFEMLAQYLASLPK